MQFAIFFKIEIVEYLCHDTCPFIPLFAINIYSTDNTDRKWFCNIIIGKQKLLKDSIEK